MPQAWRIVKEKYAASAFSGEGAARSGGRWNTRGTWVVYTSNTISLAALETLVHLNPPLGLRYVSIRIEFDEALVRKWRLRHLPVEWRDEPPPPSTQLMGDLWVRRALSAVLELPSVIIPGESNYLLNPLHADFKKIRIDRPIHFSFDPRLL